MASLSSAWCSALALALCGCDAAPPPAAKRERPVAPSQRPPPPVTPVGPALPPSPPPPDAWLRFRSERWDFVVEFPAAPATEVMSLPSPSGPTMDMHVFTSERDGWVFMVSALDGPATSRPVAPAKLLDGARDGAVANVGGRLLAETQLEHAGLPARRIEVVATPPDGELRLIGLLIARERRLYQALVVAPGPANDLAAVAGRFFASLKIAGK